MSENDLGTKKTVVVLVVVVACFAVLWPKVFYPMMVGPPHQHQRSNQYEGGCCDVISDIDVNTIKIMTQLCSNIIEHGDGKPLQGKDIVVRCRAEVLSKCGIDISAVLQEQVRLGRSFKQIVDAVRSFNGSLCLKYNFGVSPSRLGAPHRVTVNLASNYIRQERPTHLRPEMLHPALREKGRAIPQPYQAPTKGPAPKYVQGRPGPLPGIRPPMGAGAGHVAPPQKGLNSMGIIMPLYTVGIVIFFGYTLVKLIFKKKPEGPGGDLYPPVEPSPTFRKEVFESQKVKTDNSSSSKLGDAEMDQLRRRLRETELAMERIVSQMAQVPLRSQKANASNDVLYANGSAKKTQEHEQPTVKVLGMEMSASREGGKKWKRPESPIIPITPPPPPLEPAQEIFLEGALPAQSQLLVSDAVTETEVEEDSSSADPTVILASKMTLSVISLDSQDDGAKELNGKEQGDDLEEVDIDESKYTTASCTTAAEIDISEDEETDDEDMMEDEVENGPDIEEEVASKKIESTQKFVSILEPEDKRKDKSNIVEVEDEEDEEEVEEEEIEVEEEIEEEEEDDEEDNTDEMENLELDEEINEDDYNAKQNAIGDVIDDIISTGTQMSELIAAEREKSVAAEEVVTDDATATNLQSNE